MSEVEIVEAFRQACGDKTDTQYLLDVDGVKIPVYIDTDHEFTLPEIIIRPYLISKTLINDAEVTYTNNDNEDAALLLDFVQARFQVDIYTKSILDLLEAKRALQNRIYGFIRPELIPTTPTWVLYNGTTYKTSDYVPSRPVPKISESCTVFDKKDTIEDVLITKGTWFYDGTDFYVNPLTDIDSVIVHELLNGGVLDNGKTLYDTGIHDIKEVSSRKLRDKEPHVERWVFEFTVSYRDTREKNVGETMEIDLDVKENS